MTDTFPYFLLAVLLFLQTAWYYEISESVTSICENSFEVHSKDSSVLPQICDLQPQMYNLWVNSETLLKI